MLSSALVEAAALGDFEAVTAWSGRIDAAAQHPQLPAGCTLLMAASSTGQLAIVEWLLERGANVNIRAAGGINALMFATSSRHTMVVQRLLAASADVDAVRLTHKDHVRVAGRRTAATSHSALQIAEANGDNATLQVLQAHCESQRQAADAAAAALMAQEVAELTAGDGISDVAMTASGKRRDKKRRAKAKQLGHANAPVSSPGAGSARVATARSAQAGSANLAVDLADMRTIPAQGLDGGASPPCLAAPAAAAAAEAARRRGANLSTLLPPAPPPAPPSTPSIARRSLPGASAGRNPDSNQQPLYLQPEDLLAGVAMGSEQLGAREVVAAVPCACAFPTSIASGITPSGIAPSGIAPSRAGSSSSSSPPAASAWAAAASVPSSAALQPPSRAARATSLAGESLSTSAASSSLAAATSLAVAAEDEEYLGAEDEEYLAMEARAEAKARHMRELDERFEMLQLARATSSTSLAALGSSTSLATLESKSNADAADADELTCVICMEAPTDATLVHGARLHARFESGDSPARGPHSCEQGQPSLGLRGWPARLWPAARSRARAYPAPLHRARELASSCPLCMHMGAFCVPTFSRAPLSCMLCWLLDSPMRVWCGRVGVQGIARTSAAA